MDKIRISGESFDSAKTGCLVKYFSALTWRRYSAERSSSCANPGGRENLVGF
jgi:hypothetical protein